MDKEGFLEVAQQHLVIIETPFKAPSLELMRQNIAFARACVLHSLRLGESPIASHLLYTQPGILADANPEDRALGIRAGLNWYQVADRVVFYLNHGMSTGMIRAEKLAIELGKRKEYRMLPYQCMPKTFDGCNMCLENHLAKGGNNGRSENT